MFAVEADAISISSESTDKTDAESRDACKSPTPSVGCAFKPTTAAELFTQAHKSGRSTEVFPLFVD